MNKTVEFYCDEDDEIFVLENRFDVAVPVVIREIDGEGVYVECYPQIEETVRRHVEEFENSLFSDEALHALHRSLAPYLDKWGYRDDRHRMRRYEIYRGEAMLSDREEILSGTRPLTEEDDERNQTTQDISYALENGALVFGYEENGKIISLAATHIDDGVHAHYREVMVETVPAARRRGLALSCLRALKNALAQEGYGIEYRTALTNRASRKTAQRVGLSLVGHCYYYVLRCEG